MQTPGLLESIINRLVEPRPDCLLWRDAVDRGYGRIFVDGRSLRAHRVVWELVHGPIPEGLTIDHLCRVRSCCNPDHMEVVTLAENNRRARLFRPAIAAPESVGDEDRSKWNSFEGRTHCLSGRHELTPENVRVRGTRRSCKACDRESQRRRRAAGSPH